MIADHLVIEGQELVDHIVIEHADVVLPDCTVETLLDVLRATHIRAHTEAN